MKQHHYLVALLLSVCFGLGAMVYKTTLPQWIEDDEVDLIMSEEAKHDPTYLDRELVSTMGYDMYVYPKLVYALSRSYEIQDYALVLIGVSTALTVFGAYVALVWLGYSPYIAMGVAMVALFPRFAPADTFGALLVSVTGRSFAIPIVWLITAWYIRRMEQKKLVWPVFLGIGLASYVHPVSMITFVVVLTLVHTTLLMRERAWRPLFYTFLQNSIAFMVGAAGLLYEIMHRTGTIATPVTDRIITSGEYLAAIRARAHYEFLETSTEWFRHEFIISFIFLVALAYVWYRIRTGSIARTSIEYLTTTVGTLLTVYAFVVHLAVPAIQIYLVRTFNIPLVLWNFCRTFKYVYLGLLLVFAVAVKEVYVRYGKVAAFMLLGAGMVSSSYFFEWAQFFAGYTNYQKEYIPLALQDIEVRDPYEEYRLWCEAFSDVGVREGDVVLSTDYLLRYFCKIRPHITREEGYAHLFMGRASLMDWYVDLQVQNAVLTGTSSESVLWYAREVGATAVVLPRESPAATILMDSRLPFRVRHQYLVVGVTL